MSGPRASFDPGPGRGPHGRRYAWRADAARPHESIWSLLQKFSFLNAVRNSQCVRLFRRMDSAHYRQVWDLGHEYLDLAALGAATVGRRRLETTGLVEGYLGGAERVREFLHLVGATLRYCPLCLAEGFHSPVHQMLFLAACPVHGVALHDRCPACRGLIRVDLKRSAPPFGCRQCRHAFWPAMGEPAAWPPQPGRRAADAAFAGVARWLRRASRAGDLLDRTLLVNSGRLDLRHENPADQNHRRPALTRLPRLWREALGEQVPAFLLAGPALRRGEHRVYLGPSRRGAAPPRTLDEHLSLRALDLYNGVHRWLYHRRLRRQRRAIVEACGRGLPDRPRTVKKRDRTLAWAYLAWRRYWEEEELKKVMGRRRWTPRSARHAVVDGFLGLLSGWEGRLPTDPALLDRVLIHVLLATFMESILLTRRAHGRGDRDLHFYFSGALTPVLVRSAHPRRRLAVLIR